MTNMSHSAHQLAKMQLLCSHDYHISVME